MDVGNDLHENPGNLFREINPVESTTMRYTNLQLQIQRVGRTIQHRRDGFMKITNVRKIEK